jgi:hypothetical protein
MHSIHSPSKGIPRQNVRKVLLKPQNITVTYCTGIANFMYKDPNVSTAKKFKNWTSQWYLKINNIWPEKLALVGRKHCPNYPCFSCDHTSDQSRWHPQRYVTVLQGLGGSDQEQWCPELTYELSPRPPSTVSPEPSIHEPMLPLLQVRS